LKLILIYEVNLIATFDLGTPKIEMSIDAPTAE
jgi:hypothetical protein